jgi:hypothetical protein
MQYKAVGFQHLDYSFSNLLLGPWTHLTRWLMMCQINVNSFQSLVSVHRATHFTTRWWNLGIPCTTWRWWWWSSSSSLLPVFKIEALIWVSFCKALNFQPSGSRVGSSPIHQPKNIKMKYKTHVKLVHELYGACFQYNTKNQESTI